MITDQIGLHSVLLGNPLFFLHLASSDRPKFVTFFKKVMTKLNHFSLEIILLIYLKNDHSNSIEKNGNIFYSK